MKWTVDNPLILETNQGEIIIANRWFINRSDELIYTNSNDYFNLAMYDGSDQPKSFVANAYRITKGEEEDG